MDLRLLGIRSSSFSTYISLGVVEHDSEGPDAILREAHRVLEPSGILILSVPYMNGIRRLGAWWIRRRNLKVQEAGGEFYQFVFFRLEARAFLERNGFRVMSAIPYDPARILRGGLRSASRLFRTKGSAVHRSPRGAKRTLCVGEVHRQESAPSGVRKVLRRLLYTRPSLHAFGHMILFVAVKAD
jgi:SAM-dependent methyltransferase